MQHPAPLQRYVDLDTLTRDLMAKGATAEQAKLVWKIYLDSGTLTRVERDGVEYLLMPLVLRGSKKSEENSEDAGDA